MKPEQKEKVEKFVVKMDEVKKKVDEGVQSKVMPLIKGHEGVIVVVLVVMIVAGLSMKALFFGMVAAGVMLVPVYVPIIIEKLSKKEEPKIEAPAEEKKEETKVE